MNQSIWFIGYIDDAMMMVLWWCNDDQ